MWGILIFGIVTPVLFNQGKFRKIISSNFDYLHVTMKGLVQK